MNCALCIDKKNVYYALNKATLSHHSAAFHVVYLRKKYYTQ